MLTYASRFLSGDLEPFWPHVALLLVAVLSSIAVGVGIILERPKFSPAVHRVAFWLVVVGIGFEAVCTIFLFVFDEGISNKQQAEIKSLVKENEILRIHMRGGHLIGVYHCYIVAGPVLLLQSPLNRPREVAIQIFC